MNGSFFRSALNLRKKVEHFVYYVRTGTLLEHLEQRRHWHFYKRKEVEWQQHVSTGKPFMYILPGGSRIILYPDDVLSKNIYFGEFECGEQDFVRRFLRPGDIFVDVGANIGLYTLIAARCVGTRGHVFAFEPVVQTFERLKHNVAVNRLQNATLVPLALSDQIEERPLTVSREGYQAWSSLGQPSHGQTSEQELVSCTTWDAFAEEHHLLGRVCLMKIDIEGWELHFLLGARRALADQRPPHLMIEFTEENARNAGTTCAELYYQLENLGYQMYRINSGSKSLVREPLRSNYPFVNLIATKDVDLLLSRLRWKLEENS